MQNPGHSLLARIILLILLLMVYGCLPADRSMKPAKDNLPSATSSAAPAAKTGEGDQLISEKAPLPAGPEETAPAPVMATPANVRPAPDLGSQMGAIAPAASRPYAYPDDAGMAAGDATIKKPSPATEFGAVAGKAARTGSLLDRSAETVATAPLIPEFPWPPPQTSATQEIPDNFLRNNSQDALQLGQVDNIIKKALDNSGYFDHSYFAVPDGFALATRLENINLDGTPKSGDDRWAIESGSLRAFSIESYLRALFTSNPGFFRIVVFIITPHPFTQTDSTVSRKEATAWINRGLNKLPHEIAIQPYTDQYSCTALIYEFEKIPGEQMASTVIPGKLPGRTHLERAALWEGLQQ